MKHLRTVHMYTTESLAKVTSNSALFSYKKYTSLVAPSTEAKVSTKSFYCEVCGKQFSYKHQLRTHIAETHTDQQSFPCRSAHTSFTCCIISFTLQVL